MKIQRLLMCGIVLAACAHGSAHEAAITGAYAPEQGVRTKGGSSAAWRINALIASGQYAEADSLIAESIAAGLLTRAAGEELQEKIKKASDERKNKGEDTEPRRPPPLVKTRETCSSAFRSLRLCYELPDEFSYHSEQQALNAMKGRLGQKNLSLHHREAATEGPCPGIGTHVNVRLNGKREGSITCCRCCVDAESGPIEWEKCRIVW